MITLSTRTMSPRNVQSNVVTATPEELILLQEAITFFKNACRSIVGYKQLAERAGVTIIVEKIEKKTEAPVTPKRNPVLDKFKVTRRRNYDIVNPNTVKQEEKPIDAALLDWQSPKIDEWAITEEEINSIETTISFKEFATSVHQALETDGRLDSKNTDLIVKTLWGQSKDNFAHESHKAAAKALCIEVHVSFNCFLNDYSNPTMKDYTYGYFQEAILRTTP